MATALLILCAVSGVLLAVPYDVTQPYLSVTRLVTANPAASFIRNVHYWSAQLFLILTLCHIFSHLDKGNDKEIKQKGVWFRLSFSVILLFYVMISGFILKADGDSMQAQRILASLLEDLPLIGGMLRDTFAGFPGNLQILYIQHAATATILLFLVVLEHARSLNVHLRSFTFITVFIAFISLVFKAPLNDLNSDTMKGPWYFIGLQEILHWLPNPVYATVGLLGIPGILYLLYFIKTPTKRIVLQLLFALLIVYALLICTGLFFRGVLWQLQWPWQAGYRMPQLLVPDRFASGQTDTAVLKVIEGRVEGCMSCHADMNGFSVAHKPEYIGCYSCHGGDPLTLDRSLAHRTMYPVPGNLSNAAATCGNAGCHPSIAERVPHSLMATLRGMISVDRWVFGENPLPDGSATIHDVGNRTAADIHLRNLCTGCHLGAEKKKPGPPEWLERGGGCLACHLHYADDALTTLYDLRKEGYEKNVPAFHPAIDIHVSNDSCRSCHSRSGRISMNYEGWHETGLKPSEAKGRSDFMVLPDQRVFSKQPADIHHTAGLLCIDCHGSYEAMGDGNRHMHKEEAVKVQCSDCHTLKPHRLGKLSDADQETRIISWLRNYSVEGVDGVITQKSGQMLANTRVEKNDRILNLVKKSGAGTVRMKPLAEACTEGTAHNRLSCNACHTAWAPQCIGCHMSYEPETKGFDMINRKSRQGTWVEYSSEGLVEPPVLGVNEGDNSAKGGMITTFIPGMIMTMDQGSYRRGSDRIFHRLYAPASAHTTQRKGRSCESCHTNPLALGYGRGSLKLASQGEWVFEAEYADSKYDGLPEDAWAGFLKERKGPASTRTGMRPFSIVEQKRILTVGACLTCHAGNSVVMKEALHDFDTVLNRKKNLCGVPAW